MAVAQRGDIWLVNINPTKGKEQQGRRPVLIVSHTAFNRSGMAVVCPITQGGNHARFAGFAVSLMASGTQTQGVVLANQVRTLDLKSRQAQYVEAAPDEVLHEVVGKLQAMID